MKPLALAIAFTVLLIAPARAQSQEEQKSQKPPETQTQKPAADKTEQQTKVIGFIDTNGDGIDDRIAKQSSKLSKQNGNGKCERKRDLFIDNDGDGINDNRCNGLGIGNKNKCCKKRGEKK